LGGNESAWVWATALALAMAIKVVAVSRLANLDDCWGSDCSLSDRKRLCGLPAYALRKLLITEVFS
jgi:hypothetical protein